MSYCPDWVNGLSSQSKYIEMIASIMQHWSTQYRVCGWWQRQQVNQRKTTSQLNCKPEARSQKESLPNVAAPRPSKHKEPFVLRLTVCVSVSVCCCLTWQRGDMVLSPMSSSNEQPDSRDGRLSVCVKCKWIESHKRTPQAHGPQQSPFL